MPTTLLEGESWDQAYKRRFHEEAEIDARIIASLQTTYSVVVKTTLGHQTLNLMAFSSAEAVTKALAMLFDGEQPAPHCGMSISAYPILKAAA